MNHLVQGHAAALRAGIPADEVLDDLHRLAELQVARALAGNPLRFRLVHGDIENAAHMELLEQLRGVGGHAVILTRGTNDTVEHVLDPDCPVTLTAMDGFCCEYAPSWWRWTTDGSDPAAPAKLEAVR